MLEDKEDLLSLRLDIALLFSVLSVTMPDEKLRQVMIARSNKIKEEVKRAMQDA